MTQGSEVEDLWSHGPHSWREYGKGAVQSNLASTQLVIGIDSA